MYIVLSASIWLEIFTLLPRTDLTLTVMKTKQKYENRNLILYRKAQKVESKGVFFFTGKWREREREREIGSLNNKSRRKIRELVVGKIPTIIFSFIRKSVIS